MGKNRKTQKKNQSKFSNLFENTKRNHKIGGNIRPVRDLTRFVKWPKYILM